MSEKMVIEQRVEREITARMEELDQKLVAEKLERYRRLNQFAQLGKVLFVGSSLMEQFPINELLLDMGRTYTVYNRGIGGYTTQQLAKSLDVCVYELQPSQVLINIGTNDMNTPEYTVEGLMERYEAILRDIQAHVPGVKLTLLAYYETGGRPPRPGDFKVPEQSNHCPGKSSCAGTGEEGWGRFPQLQQRHHR